MPKKINTTSRILHELPFKISAFIRALFLSRPDIVICTIPPLSLGITGLLIAKIKRAKSILNVKDLQPDAAVELGMIKNKYVINLMYRLESFLYKYYEKISSLGHGVLKRIKKKGVNLLKLIYLPATADPEIIAMPSKIEHNRFIEKNNLEEGFKVLHAGNMGIKQGIEVVLKTAKLLEDTFVEFLIVGDGAKENGYLMDEDWFTYNGSKIHLRLPTIFPEKTEEFNKYAFKRFYFRPKYIMSRLSKIRSKRDIQFYLQSFQSIIKL